MDVKINKIFTHRHTNKLLASSAMVKLPLLLILCIHSASGFFGVWGPDLEGPWCAKRPHGKQCCTGRDDICAVPILGTECYCDIFCNQTAYDCCPDYRALCHGETTTTTTPPPNTPRPLREPYKKDGAHYYPGQAIMDNCNECTCEATNTVSNGYSVSRWRCTNDPCLLRPELIEEVNDGRGFTWKAGNYSKFWGMTLEEGVRYRLGTFLLEDDVLRMNTLMVFDDVIPENFDSREKWPGMLSAVRDQGNCASSWAFSTIGVAEDRLRIETDGVMTDSLSVQHLLSCNTEEQMGCDGGRLDRAWWFMRKIGVVTKECYPYTSGETDEAGSCLVGKRQKQGLCPSGIPHKNAKRFKATPAYRIRPNEREIMKEIMDNGPVQATLLIREDFFMYRRGIYRYTDLTTQRNDPVNFHKSGFHSVRIVGWGAERTERGDIIKYWTCANSWGQDWGEDGYFRILRGGDESRIESYVIGVWGRVSGDNALRLLLRENRRKRIRIRRRSRRHLRNQFRHLYSRSHRDNRLLPPQPPSVTSSLPETRQFRLHDTSSRHHSYKTNKLLDAITRHHYQTNKKKQHKKSPYSKKKHQKKQKKKSSRWIRNHGTYSYSYF